MLRRRRSAVAAVLLLAGACLSLASDAPQQARGMDDYVLLERPRADVPVGAVWVQGEGPVGASAAPDNLEEVRSLSNYTAKLDISRDVDARLASALGLKASSRGAVEIRFEDLTVVRVKDRSRLDLADGEARIVEAVKAGTIRIAYSQGSESEVRAGARALGAPVLGHASANGRSEAVLDGRGLYVAMRVVVPRRVLSHVPMRGFTRRGGLLHAAAAGLRLVVDASALERCIMTTGTRASSRATPTIASPPTFAACAAAHPLRLRLGGAFVPTPISMAARWTGPRFVGAVPGDAAIGRERAVRAIEVSIDRERLGTGSNGIPAASLQAVVSLRRLQLMPVKHPQAPGW